VTYFSPVAPRIPVEVSSLLAALQFSGATSIGLQSLSGDQWLSLLHFCELSHFTLPLAQLKIAGLPEWVKEKLEQNLTDNYLRFERVKSTYREASDALQESDIEHVVLKGFTQAPYCVPDARARQQSDLDFYILPDRTSQAREVLRSIGYEEDDKQNYSAADHKPTMLRLGNWTWRGNHFDPEMPLSIELHFCFWNEKTSLFTIPEVEQFWLRKVKRQIDDMEASTLSTVDQVGHITLHILRNLLARDIAIHHIYELAYFLHNHSEDVVFWSEWKQTHSASLREKEAIALYLARCCFSCRISVQVQEEIDRLPAVQADWLSHFGPSVCDAVFIENKDIVWLHLSLLPTGRKMFAVLRRTFLPNRIPSARSPAVVLNERKIPPRKISTLDSIRYVVMRTASYIRTSCRTMRRGFAWYVARYWLRGRSQLSAETPPFRYRVAGTR